MPIHARPFDPAAWIGYALPPKTQHRCSLPVNAQLRECLCNLVPIACIRLCSRNKKQRRAKIIRSNPNTLRAGPPEKSKINQRMKGRLTECAEQLTVQLDPALPLLLLRRDGCILGYQRLQRIPSEGYIREIDSEEGEGGDVGLIQYEWSNGRVSSFTTRRSRSCGGDRIFAVCWRR